MAAMDRRLDVLQQAYTLWHRLMTRLHSDDAWDIAVDCQAFWEKSCIFLPPEVRRRFKWFYTTAADYKSVVPPSGEASKTWDDLNRVGQEIADAASLPPIGKLEFKLLEENQDPHVEGTV